MTSALRTQALCKRFGDFVAVDSVDLDVMPGEIFGLLGPNGAGKSTTIRILCGLLSATSGKVEVAGIDVSNKPDSVKPLIGYMSQRFSLYRDLTVEENIMFFGGVYGLDAEELRLRKHWALDIAELGAWRSTLATDLPGGHAQRLALVCALLHRPQVVFLDEPTGGVDPLMRRSFFELIEQLAASGTTVLITTHFLDEAEYCHRIALIAAGKLIAQGTPTQLKQQLADKVLLDVRCQQPAQAFQLVKTIELVDDVSLHGAGLHIFWKASVSEHQALQILDTHFSSAGLGSIVAQPTTPSLEDVFIQLAQKAQR